VSTLSLFPRGLFFLSTFFFGATFLASADFLEGADFLIDAAFLAAFFLGAGLRLKVFLVLTGFFFFVVLVGMAGVYH
jgi:hypothetical protein